MSNTRGNTMGNDRQARGRNRDAWREARGLAAELRGLVGVVAPETLLPDVLTAVGLADAYFSLPTPLGPVYVAYNALGISAVARADDPAGFEAAFRARLARAARPARAPDAVLVRALEATLRGARKAELRFDLRGLSEFERAVLMKALEIPRGEVRPYGWIAREIGRPGAVRAVGTALGHNPVPILIPCHRVIRSDGSIGEYSLGGPEAKRRILAAEAVDAEALEQLAREGVRFNGCDTTHIYCFPTCRHGQRVTPAHLVRFRSHAEAAAAGYRPCKVCRPA